MQEPRYDAEGEMRIMSRLWSADIKDDPFNFVMVAFPWGKDGTPLATKTGPRKWQKKVLKEIATHIQNNRQRQAYEVFRKAIGSGRGIGKSALVAWISLWMLSTRIGASVIVSANSEAQLRSVTWAELTKWTAMLINSHWWEVSATRLMPAKWLTDIVERDLHKGTRYWSAEGRLWSEENPDSYAGLHNEDGVLVIFDEASGIPDPIWAVSSGFFTENTPNRFWFAFSNPRRNTGYFFECFHAKRDFWSTDNIDAREVEDTDKQVYEQIIEEYGSDSYQAHVEVYGRFPAAGEDQFIPPMLVADAAKRELEEPDSTAPVIVGVDPARFGSDSTVILVRRGREILEIQRHKGDDTMTVVGYVIEAIEEHKPAMVVIDEGGVGGGIVDRLKEQRYKVRGINFGNKSRNPLMWGNLRAQIWGAMRDWLKTGTIPNDRSLKADLTGPTYKPDSKGAIFLESKKDMKSRGLASPDAADALAVTFAFPVAHREVVDKRIAKPYSPRQVSNSWMSS